MAISVVQRGSGVDSNGGTGSIAVAFGSATTAGNAIILLVGSNTNTNSPFSVSDTGGNTYTKVSSINNGTAYTGAIAYICHSIAGGADTVTLNDGFNASSLHIYEVAGLASTQALDKVVYQYQNSAASMDSTSVTTSYANELLLGLAVISATSANTYTLGTGYANLLAAAGSNAHNASEEQVVSSVTSYSATINSAISNQLSLMVMYSFADTANAGGTLSTDKYDVAFSFPILTKTQVATARIANNFTKTQTATAKIGQTQTKTQPAIARIAQNYTKTQTATARIATKPTKTQGAIARIVQNLTKTQSAIARITQPLTKTQAATARISQKFTKTQTATAKIVQLQFKNQPATARVVQNLTKTQTAIAKIVVNSAGSKTQTAIARIAQKYSKTQGATARIQQTLTKTQTATARIQRNLTKTQGAIARLYQTVSKTQTATARIKQTLSKTQPATARIVQSLILTQTATAKIIKTPIKTQTATANIVTGGDFKRWNGTKWVNIQGKAWNGSIWKKGVLKRWNGSAWVRTHE
jgi:hypothetical protein